MDHLNWEKLFKRYVWHDERTPYLTRAANLTQLQAQYELFCYSLLMAMLFGVLSVALLSSALPHGDAAWVSIYAFTVCCASVLLGATRQPWAAMWCAGAPLAVLAYFGYWGFHPGYGFEEKTLLIMGVTAWLLYSRRVVAVARAWQRLAGPG